MQKEAEQNPLVRILKNKIIQLILIIIFLAGFVYAVAWVGDDVDYLPVEDTLYTHNLSANISSPASDMLFSVDTIDTVTLWNNEEIAYSSISSWIFVSNSTLGTLLINATRTNETGNFSIPIKVTWNNGASATTTSFRFNITAVNDAPQFSNLENKSFNATELFEYIINITDEENNIPFSYNITFLSCSVAQWSTRDCGTPEGKILFTEEQYTNDTTAGVINISFTPGRNDVGSYIINFTVTDSGNSNPANAQTSQLVNFTVLNLNVAPYFRYVCDNEQSGTEDTEHTCYINVSDIDEEYNMTFIANYTWFLFDSTLTNSTILTLNATTFFNASALVNFTATDTEVGNWSINISLYDTGNPQKSNSTILNLYIENNNDSVTIDGIENLTAYTTNNYTLYMNATDNDLKIPDKSVYNESLTFTSNNTNLVLTSSNIENTNKTQLSIAVDPNLLEEGLNLINISVHDANNFSSDSIIFNITVVSNNAPEWLSPLQNNHSLTEGTEFYLNLSANVTDSDVGDSINFVFSNTTSFASFTINTTTGEINFTPIDADVGYHLITINATDGKTHTPQTFNFTVTNINDNPLIVEPLQTTNASVDASSNINADEDNRTQITLFAEDDDFKIPSNQKSFYNENHTISLTIQGPNTNLFNFTKDNSFPSINFPNRTKFVATFTPNKTDVGEYNITVQITDFSSASDSLIFNLTVSEVQHPPTMTSIGNIETSILETLYLDVNATDLEDINETYEYSNITYKIVNLTTGGNFINETNFNSTTGVLNFTFSQTYAGVWAYNISVNDSAGLSDSEVFNITVFDYPYFLLPLSSYQFNLVENVSSQLNFTVNQTTQTTLNYTLMINGIIRNSTTGNGNGTEFLWYFAPNFTDETTCSGVINLTLNISNSKLSNSTSWNLTINHTNYPLGFNGTIGGDDQTVNGGSSVSLNLSNYFTDIDASDSCVNQTVGFNYTLINATSGTISVAIINWTNGTIPSITFSSSSTAIANYSLTGIELNTTNESHVLNTADSNNFSVQLTVDQVTTPVQTPSSGGGSSDPKTVSLKIIMPEPVKAKKKDRLTIPVEIKNDGETLLNTIDLTTLVTKLNLPRTDLTVTLDTSAISSLAVGASKNLAMIINVDTEDSGLFEVRLNASVKSPKYTNWGSLFVEVEEEQEYIEKIVFTEEFIIGNPECAELKEIMDEARELLAQGKREEALQKSEEALDACRRAIAQPLSSRIKQNVQEKLFGYITIASIVALALGFGYYEFRKYQLRKALMQDQANI